MQQYEHTKKPVLPKHIERNNNQVRVTGKSEYTIKQNQSQKQEKNVFIQYSLQQIKKLIKMDERISRLEHSRCQV